MLADVTTLAGGSLA